MLRQHSSLVRNLLAFGDLLAVFIAFWGAFEVRQALELHTRPLGITESAVITLLGISVVSLWMWYRIAGIYRSRRLQPFRNEAWGILVANGATLLILLALVTLLKLPNASRLLLAMFIALNTVSVFVVHSAGRIAIKYLRSKGYNTRNLLLVGRARHRISTMVDKVSKHGWWGFRTAAAVCPAQFAPLDIETLDGAAADSEENRLQGTDGELDFHDLIEGEQILDRQPIDEVWIDGFPEQDSPLRSFADSAAQRGIAVRYVLSESHTPGSRWGFELVGGMETLASTTTPVDELALSTKRIMDVVGAIVALTLFAPTMLIAALLVHLEDRGPVFFKQVRVGLNGRRFVMFKFRSMGINAERQLDDLKAQNEMSGPVFKMSSDPRITRVGKWIRKLSIDEMPQLFNVLRGEMSLVGPRPPIPSEVDMYEPEQRRRLSVKPGITGLWQVNGRNEIADFDKWVGLDLEYIDRWSLGLDVSILLRTIPAVLASRGAK